MSTVNGGVNVLNNFFEDQISLIQKAIALQPTETRFSLEGP